MSIPSFQRGITEYQGFSYRAWGVQAQAGLSSPFFTQALRLGAVSQSLLYAHLSNNGAIPVRYRGEGHMSIMQGVSLLLAVGLFVYLLAALLRADRG